MNIEDLEPYCVHPWAWEHWLPQGIQQLLLASAHPAAAGHSPEAGWFVLQKAPEGKKLLYSQRMAAEPTAPVQGFKYAQDHRALDGAVMNAQAFKMVFKTPVLPCSDTVRTPKGLVVEVQHLGAGLYKIKSLRKEHPKSTD